MLREKQVGINLRYLRECEELEVEEMAPKLHLTPEALRVLESGDAAAAIPLRTLTTLYTRYGISPQQLFMPFHLVIANTLIEGK